MGKVQKKNAKGRLDRYYNLAKEKGYRARSSFKILQINEKYGHFLEKSKVVVDLCAAPGSWCQVASQLCPVNSLIIGVDIVPMKPLPKCILFQADITTEDCRSQLRGYLKTWKADTFLHDGAPNVGQNWIHDAYTQSQLTLEALRLATEHLNPGGTFITKVFRSRDYNNLIWVFKQLFLKVEATKPPASRNVSAEIFVVCKGFKAPKRMDPKFLDPKSVFEEVAEGPVNNEMRVYNPNSIKRSRIGYADGDMTLFHPMDLMEWVKQEEDVVNTLGSVSTLEVDTTIPEWKILKHMKQTTPELLECLKDLKVLAKKDFRLILRWRKHARESLGLLDEKDQEAPTIEVAPLTEDERIEQEMHHLKEKELKEKKRERRRKNEAKQKELQRLQMNMLTDMQIGQEKGQGEQDMFSINTARKSGQLKDIARGKKSMVIEQKDEAAVPEEEQEEAELLDSDEEVDELERQLDADYAEQKEANANHEARLKAQLDRDEEDQKPWDGIQDEEGQVSSDGDLVSDDDSDNVSDDDSDDDEAINKLIASISEKKKQGALSQTASSFFSDSIFKGVNLDIQAPEAKKPKKAAAKVEKEETAEEIFADSDGNESDHGDFEIVPNDYDDDSDMDYDTDSDAERQSDKHKKDIDIASVQAMTMAHELATGKKSKYDLIGDGYNKYSFRDTEGVPEWFVEDEKQHNKINRPITKEASQALKQKMRLLNARPIKKVMEAQARKKMRAVKRLEKIKKKSELIMEDGSKSQADKATEIQKMMHRMTKKKVKPQVTVIAARGSNRGLQGRPKGVRGKYKMVDGVMKNEMRALKRIEKRNKKHKKH